MSHVAAIIAPAVASAARSLDAGPGLWSGVALGLGAGLVAGSTLAWHHAARRWRALEETLALGRALVDAGRPPDRAPVVPSAQAHPRMRHTTRGPVTPATGSRRVGVAPRRAFPSHAVSDGSYDGAR